jgi:2-polyprenyl-6-methoxyphenol hydroxylase-like FAD-dependent oxidoreductase
MGCALADFVQHGDMVLATVEHDGETEAFDTQYLIGCDGGHSIVCKTGNFSFLI